MSGGAIRCWVPAKLLRASATNSAQPPRPGHIYGIATQVLEDEVLRERVPQDGLALREEEIVAAVAGVADHVEGVAVADRELLQLDEVRGPYLVPAGGGAGESSPQTLQ